MKRTLFFCLGIVLSSQAYTQQTIDSTAVETFFDRVWSESMHQDGVVPGAVVTVVHQGKVVLNKGYGASNNETDEAVDAVNTRVRIGSTSKLFTVMTALSLVDEGRLELDRDVNAYLAEVKVPETYAEPVTVRTLMSHLSGFDASISGAMVYDNNDLSMDPNEYQRRLQRVRPVGREYGYDNMGLGLLGHVSGQVNGTSFAEAVAQRVLRPLRLYKTSMGVPDPQMERLGACHSWDQNKQLVGCTHKYMREVFQGAGAITTTGSDMARFMLALLNRSCLEGICVLQDDTFAKFTDMDRNRLHPNASGMGFIIYEKDFAGRFAIGHDGGQDGFSTTMTLFPDSGTGIFISQFSYGGIPDGWGLSVVLDMFSRGFLVNTYGQSSEAQTKFAETFLPEPIAEQPAAGEFDKDDLTILDGIYLGTRQIGSSLLDRLLRSMGVLRVSVSDDEVTLAGQGPYKQTGAGVLSMEGVDADWLYTRTANDVILQNSAGSPVDMFVQKPWHMDGRWSIYPLGLVILLALPALVFAFVKRKTSTARNVGFLVFFTGVAVTLGLYLELEYYATVYFPEGSKTPLMAWRLLLNLGWLAALFSLFLTLTNRGDLIDFRGVLGSLRSLLVLAFAVASIGVVVLLPYWGLIGNFTH